MLAALAVVPVYIGMSLLCDGAALRAMATDGMGLLVGASVTAVAATANRAGKAREPLVAGIGGVFLKADNPATLPQSFATTSNATSSSAKVAP